MTAGAYPGSQTTTPPGPSPLQVTLPPSILSGFPDSSPVPSYTAL